MNRLQLICSTLVLMFVCTLTLTAQPTAEIAVKGYSHQEIHDAGLTTPRATGLDVVGVNQMVYLVGDAGMTTYAWTLVSTPDGSAAVLGATDLQEITFIPDMVGKFQIDLVVTDDTGTSEAASRIITVAKFVGVGGMDGLPIDVGAGQCTFCHATNFDQWAATDHATMFSRAIDGEVSSHYAEYCIECHTTGYDADADGNDGFDDVQAELGWLFPDTLEAGNWTDVKDNFEKLAHRANIQCESCHGPASLHGGKKDGIDMSLDAAVCGYCHEEEPYHTNNIQWKNSKHAIGYARGATRGGCADCHSGWGFIRKIDPMDDDKRPELGVKETTCAVCHDPHSKENPAHVRSMADITLADGVTVIDYGGQGKLCMQCHQGRRPAIEYAANADNISSHFGSHYSNQADMLDGSNAIDYGIPIGTSGHKYAVTEACVGCHMADGPAEGEPGFQMIGNHSFNVRHLNGTPDDPSDDVQNTSVCEPCHGPIDSWDDIKAKADWDQDGVISSTTHEVESMMHKLGTLLPPFGSPDVLIDSATVDWRDQTDPKEIAYRKALLKATFNYQFVHQDGSHGIHNAGYSLALMRRSIASLTTGDIGAGEIISITDIPNDQGKQVRIAWSKFASDGPSANPLQSYSVYRMMENGAVGKAEKVESFDQMLAQSNSGNVGTKFRLIQEGETWDFVAWIPAAGYETYSIVVPTLYDKTPSSEGISTFKIAGTISGRRFETAPASGFSVDNLVPMAPANATLEVTDDGVLMAWDESEDADFNYFAIYRSEESGFAPSEDNILATLTGLDYIDADVTIGTKYFYRIAAFDFSENQGDLTSELTASITGVAGSDALPTEYALMNNYPNPFNPETTIEYQLPTQGNVTLRVYSMLGTEVRTLVEESQAVGKYSVVWDGRDDTGNALSSGMYMYRLESGSFSAVKKMVLMK
ncbi:MAG: T9SS C-terminal target domain-containing protein [Calditrichaeota bacterium]|nr:MAG: T9SS C-terminal target domain-containing protein [Calditrichota bacterium]